MTRALSLILQALWACFKAGFFVVKIVISYFLKCLTDVLGAMKDEWINRELDDEIY